MRIIYADSLFFLNFIVDYLLLFASARLCSLPIKRMRLAAGAIFGGLYAVMAVVTPVPFALVTVKLLAGAVTAAVGLGTERIGRKILCFFALSAGFGGAVCALCTLAGIDSGGAYISVSIPVLAGAFALCYAAVSLVFRGKAARPVRKIAELELTLAGRRLAVPTLVDTGNELHDPTTGLPAAVVEAEAASALFTAEAGAYLNCDPVEALQHLRRINCPGSPRIVFCRSVGGAASALLCFSPDCSAVDGESRRLCFAITRAVLSPDGEYKALINLQ